MQSNADIQNSLESRCFLLLALLACVLCFNLARQYRSSAEPTEIVLNQKINPNIASLESMIRLPGIGPARAGAVLEYRKSRPTDAPAFTNYEDLQKVHGIGPVISKRLKPWLEFEMEQSQKENRK